MKCLPLISIFRLLFGDFWPAQRKKEITVGNGIAASPFEEVDHDAERLAKEFERKYGNAYGGSDSRSMKQAAADKGSGYDENNGFIDDSEAVSGAICKVNELIKMLNNFCSNRR